MTTYQISAPEPFDFSNPDDWSKWIQRFERFRDASELSAKTNDNQVSTLIYSMGTQAEDIYQSFRIPTGEGHAVPAYKTIKEKFDNYFTKKKNVIYERAKFNRRTQEEGEPVDTFITSLYKLATKCNYGELGDEMIRDRIVVGIRNEALSERMQLDETLTLEKATKMVRESEAVKRQQPEIRNTDKGDVDLVSRKPARQRPHVHSPSSNKAIKPQRPAQGMSNATKQTHLKESVCTRCGKKHPIGRNLCPARLAKCFTCGKTGHFNRMCRSWINDVEAHEQQNTKIQTPDWKFLGAVIGDRTMTKPWMTSLKLNQRVVNFKIDTGADVTVIPTTTYKIEDDGPLRKTKILLVGPGQNKLRVRGCFDATLEKGTEDGKETIYVVDGLKIPLAGRATIRQLNLISELNAVTTKSRNEIIERFPELFNKLGHIKGTYQIKLEDDAKPFSINTPRRVPIPLLSKVKNQLEKMETDGVISKVNEPTDWCAGMVVVPKPDGRVRICVDLTKLNRYVKRERHILPSVDHVLGQIGDAKFFSKLDANSGFWQIEMSPETAKLTTFITPFGRYHFNRLPFGISSAPEFFQKKMAEILRGCEGVVGLIDDLLIHGQTEEEHHRRLIKVLEKLKSEGVTLNQEKCQFYATETSFLGHVVNGNGVSPDPQKTKAIRNLSRPKDITETRRFLGMLNQLSKFSPHLAERTKPIRELLSTKRHWHWGPSQEKAFTQLKENLCTETCLALYEPHRETIVSADASAYGIGGVLRQKQCDGSLKPIAYVSRSMTECEQRYAQIEKEALALTWTCERLNQYLLGSKFMVETDHKPLVPLLSNKNLEELPIRVQRFRLRMMRYQYTIRHVPGKDLNTADFLSRSPLPNTENKNELQDETEAYINMIVNNLPASDKRLQEIRKHQEQDSIVQKWKNEILSGRRKRKSTRYGDLSVINGLVMRGRRIVIPKDIQEETLIQLHTGHQGVFKCKERARNSVWWPGISTDIERFVGNCRVCCKFQRPRFEPLCPSKLPDVPWQKVGTDLFEWKQSTYLLVVDYYSRYIEIAKLTSTTSKGVIDNLKSIFARHGIPQTVVSDNGPQYASSEFTRFSKEFQFHHITSSPRYPQANGEAERAVQTIKRLLNKSKDPYECLLAYRSTPLKLGYSPAELLMGRVLRTTVPIQQEHLQPKIPDRAQVEKKDAELKEKQKKNFDKRHLTLEQKSLEQGDEVWIRDQETSGEVEQERDPRSYIIRTSSGTTIRRNRRDLNLLPGESGTADTTGNDESPNASEERSERSPPLQRPRSQRPSKPPDRYGVWVNNISQN